MSTAGAVEPGLSPHQPASPWARRVVVPRTGSTNADLRACLSGPDGLLDPVSSRAWPHLSVLRAVEQTQGRGRAAHRWLTPPVGALTASVVLRPLVPAERLGWLPLLSGLAVCQALSPLVAGCGWALSLKWPNDVVALPGGAGAEGQDRAPRPGRAPQTAEPEVPGWGQSRKLAGVLTELVAPRGGLSPQVPADRESAGGVVVGIGVNLGQQATELPVPWAASLSSLGASPRGAALLRAGRAGCRSAGADGGPADSWDADVVLDLVGHRLAALLRRWEAAQGDPDAPGCPLGAALRRSCSTLGQWCQVQVPGRPTPLEGLAVGLEPGLVLREQTGSLRVLAVADVTSMRHPSVIWDTLAR